MKLVDDRIGDARSCLGSCLFCGTEVAVPGGSTTGMFSHLNVHHPDAFKEAKKVKHVGDTLPLDLIKHSKPTTSCSSTKPIINPYNLYKPCYPETQLYHKSPVVSVKPLEPRHVQLSVFPYLYHSYLKMKSTVHPIEDISSYDLILHCKHGVVMANKLLLAAVSHFARKLLEQCHQQISHMVIPDISVQIVQHFIKSIYHGTLNFKDDSLHPLFNIFGIPYNVKTPTTPPQMNFSKEDTNVDSEEDSEDESYLEPELNLDVETSSMAESDSESSNILRPKSSMESDIEAKAQELKEKIFAECGVATRQTKQVKLLRNTRNPSKIWKWFTKTPAFIYCKICGLGIKNSGNTTNASSHLKRHPDQYAEFRLETATAQMMEASPDIADHRDQDQDNIIWRYFQISNKSNRKARCVVLNKF